MCLVLTYCSYSVTKDGTLYTIIRNFRACAIFRQRSTCL
jgi:hypothetical protein